MSGKSNSEPANPAILISRKTGNWWQDGRRNWCAYCGTGLGGNSSSGEKLTRDHVIPRIHAGRHVTIPACRPCNANKGKAGLPEFMLSDYFGSIRQNGKPNKWPLRDLWLVMAMAAVEQARSVAKSWPVEKGGSRKTPD